MMKNPNTNTQRQTAKGMRQFFEWLEGRFGGPGTLPMDSGAAGEILTRDALHLDDLQRLVTHQATALHVKNYYPKASAIALGAQLAQQAQQGQAQNWKVSTAQGLESSDVFTLGAHAPYNIAVANNQVDEYYEGVQQELQQRRRRRSLRTPTSDEDDDHHDDDTATTTTAKLLWPLDQFRLDLDQVWPQGAGLARHDACPSKCRSGGLTRVTMGPTRWKRGFVHVDELAPLSNTNGFFSANIYLQLPNDDVAAEAQPILEIWPLAVRSKWDWYRNAHTLSALSSQDAEGQILLRKALGEPHRIAVEPGDLILLCVQRPHAAIGFAHSGVRVSLQCFMQYAGDDKRLAIEA